MIGWGIAASAVAALALTWRRWLVPLLAWRWRRRPAVELGRDRLNRKSHERA